MPRLTAVDPTTATGKTKTLLDAVQAKLGVKPNMARTMAQSPAVLEAYLGFVGALSAGKLQGQLQTRIALAVANANECEYCVAAHVLLGKGAGLSDSDIASSLRPISGSSREDAALKFALAVVETRGGVSDADLRAVTAAGFGESEIVEIISHVALNVFTNYMNRVAQTTIDFPAVAPALRGK